ncbi:type VI secretion system contractile sheath large subunit [uncultured Thiodictyon sp.]|uniref:type VI secretion system contractile sheath domain-containing protein n=1 Tax=uncultured Thiodictyon sp. TaxID=1846217 RepID=UPI0025E917C9|nr:type VI secretion system contractile sheath large subunit [uncultured Thiodictyon sp.]
MKKPHMQFDFSFSNASGARPRDETDPFRILVLGRFGGAAVPLAQRTPIGVDIDNFEQIFARLAPRLELVLDGTPLTIEFGSPDDFHPDRLFERLAPFVALRRLRTELADPAQFSRAAAALGGTPAAAPDPVGPASVEGADDLERLLGRAPSTPPAAAAGGADLTAWLHAMVSPHVVPDIGHEQRVLLAAVDEAIAEQMRRVLHDPAFQALESLWRGVERLVRELDLGETLHLSLLDVTRDELAQDLATHGADLARSVLHGHLCGPRTTAPDGQPWSLLVTDLDFGADLDELQLLAVLGAMAGRAGAPLLAAARPSLLGCATVERLGDPPTWQPLEAATLDFWQALRQSPVAPWIGLAAPRILVRLPYGKDSDPIGAFAFEELAVREHADYLWGSPALALALLAGQAFMESGWELDLETGRDLGDLPSHIYRDEGAAQQQPCAEIAMGEAAGAAVLRAGVMPLLSYRNRNAARLLRWQSIADPARVLAGAWAGA